MKKKIVLTEAELDKKFLPNVISVIKAGNTIGMQCQNGNWLVSFYFFDKGMPLRTMSHPVSINILVALNDLICIFVLLINGEKNSIQLTYRDFYHSVPYE